MECTSEERVITEPPPGFDWNGYSYTRRTTSIWIRAGSPSSPSLLAASGLASDCVDRCLHQLTPSHGNVIGSVSSEDYMRNLGSPEHARGNIIERLSKSNNIYISPNHGSPARRLLTSWAIRDTSVGFSSPATFKISASLCTLSWLQDQSSPWLQGARAR